MQAKERVRGGLRAVVYTGTAAEVDRYLVRVRRSGELVGHDKPAPAGRGLWQVRAVLWATSQPVRVPRTALPPPPVPWRPGVPGWLTPQVARWAGGVLAAVAVLGVAGWLLVRAVSSAAAWTADHSGQIVAALALAGLGGVVWLARKLGRRGGTPGCTTITVHTRRCRGH